ncbi:hypothetical protein H7K24_11375 [Mycobacterium fragae]|uniref:Alanine and proline-rich secreted protein Apa n=1 Tax=Mycobacterium fragae TaxID=1260918 RepID=A0A1X1V006_9MYCO|nr:alanine and proline-rich secreted protein Apa [Mycobacterium fragae]MCV7400759.1 hypothetical protein [Mycobacterium fragae]ORV62403.1 hypothetical protein AWC06_10540 [Mycobacterium fragae]
MDQVNQKSTWPQGCWGALRTAAITVAGAVTIALPTATATADPVPPPPPNPNGAAAPGPAGPGAAPPAADPVAAPPGAGPNAPAPPGSDPNAPQPGRVDNPAGAFSYIIPAGWVESDASHLDYGSALLSKETGPAQPGQPPPVANDTRIVLGRLDQKLYASAEQDNTKAATRLASDMGEFFMPYPGTRMNQETTPLSANGMTGAASYYEVKFSDTSKPNGQIWTGVVGPVKQNQGMGANQRWFVVWLGTSNDPVDKVGAKALAESVLPLLPAPPAPAGPAPAPGAPAPAPGAPGAPAPAPNAPPPPPPAPGQPTGQGGPVPAPAPVAT